MKATAEIMTMDGVRGKQTQYVCARDGRVLTHYLVVLEDQGRVRSCQNLYIVVSESGCEYLDEMQLEDGEYSDREYRDCRYNHIRRVAFAVGAEFVPMALHDIVGEPGEHYSGEPKWSQ